MQSLDPFHDIRPYQDEEVAEVLARLTRCDEFAALIAGFEFPRLARYLGPLMRALVKRQLHRRFDPIRSVRDFQLQVADIMARILDGSSAGVTSSGLDKLDPNKAYLFVSNHRDIALDPALVNWVRYQAGMDTVRIGIGDNLLKRPYATDLMRLNKSFIVKRSAKGVRELAAALGQLSAYIDHSLQEGQSVWIAQREGRAKDGLDLTEPALLKMLFLAHRKQRSFSEMVDRLAIVPVTVSYEIDPCDKLKARELATLASTGCYEKGELEDLKAIGLGLTGQKGRIHVAFGEPIQGEGITDPDQLAAELDRQIQGNYHLFPSNLAAAGVSDEAAPWLAERVRDLPAKEAALLKAAYANPVLSAEKLKAEPAERA
ncbi:1-acyl-sn-glycerol-3-phosphate acyltransferase [Gallaecimonas kandeliae]|uniref:1-acyl-sn-glycerol-3-phosphate acyltransferase n=1 Tax=Gallaecimonas kandeliae TaxID=3029055 RepID=UPI0026481F95|nr:1-acyl-sn-glycerol-3-phosphate acyltransferase [Gallaecimonas kandeliae]WKE64429.1 1-acyl-sn-glycerol-3-phosphate acyltransferase [Gallaecimonas kandeliae]